MSNFSIFFLSGQKKNLFGSGQKVPGSKAGRPLIYCGSKVSSGQIIRILTNKRCRKSKMTDFVPFQMKELERLNGIFRTTDLFYMFLSISWFNSQSHRQTWFRCTLWNIIVSYIWSRKLRYLDSTKRNNKTTE